MIPIPVSCSNIYGLRELTCCPDTGEGVCGSNANRGECVNLQLPNHRNDTTDVRNNFPHLVYYIRACQCNGNYAGYDCSRCKFGYYGSDCSQRQVLPRQSIADFSDEDWSRYNSILNQTRTYDSGHVAVLEETVPGTTNLQMSNLTLYGMFIWLHHYAAKDSLVQARPLDFAHTGFNTWHRLLSVWLEWEIQGMLLSMSDSNYHMFRLPYWDWRQELQRSSGLGSDDLFVANRIGATRNDNGRARVYGDLYGDGWETMCWFKIGEICNPSENTGILQRCPFTGTNPCSTSNPDWPTTLDVVTALAIDDFDVPPYNITSIGGYRAHVDFINGIVSHEQCRNDRQCRCVPSLDPNCTDETEITQKTRINFIGSHNCRTR